MKKVFLFLMIMTQMNAVTPSSDELVVLHNATTAEMNAITSPTQGALIFNSDDKEIYEYDGTQWNRISSTGTETKVQSGECIDMTGVGTPANPYVATRSTPGKTQATAGLVCKQLFDTGCAMTDGMYWINPDGGSTDNAFEVYCDMTTKGGGWTRVDYSADLTHQQQFTGGDAARWMTSDFTFNLTDTQINNIRNNSTEARQQYVGSCQGVIHYLYQDTNFGSAFGFRFHNDEETLFGIQHYKNTNITVISDDCKQNDTATLRSTIFHIEDIRLPVINVHSNDNGDNNEKFGSPLTNNPAWFR